MMMMVVTGLYLTTWFVPFLMHDELDHPQLEHWACHRLTLQQTHTHLKD